MVVLARVAVQAHFREAKVKAHCGGRNHNVSQFSNRMLDTTVALMSAK
jgi:hypothetical protein